MTQQDTLKYIRERHAYYCRKSLAIDDKKEPTLAGIYHGKAAATGEMIRWIEDHAV
jgi:hypothetical protein